MLRALAVVVLTALAAAVALPDDQIGVSPSGHFVTFGNEVLLLIGESGTQCVPQNANINYRQWIDDCASRGIRAIHVWSFAPLRQHADGSKFEERWGYVIPGLTPWARHASGPKAADQLPYYDFMHFDDGADSELTRYWPRIRDICRYAKSKRMLVGITLFTGWAKHDADWVYHPLNAKNGGHLKDVKQAVQIASPETEVYAENWQDSWDDARKTQWVWERLADEYIRQLNRLGNVFFVFLDEHSYDEGNMGDHFASFFRKRNAVYVDWAERRDAIDFVYSDTLSHIDKNRDAVKGFLARSAKPYMFLEGEPYHGDAVRLSIWSFAMGGGHFFFHADTDQETPHTGIMGYDPKVPGGDTGMIRRDWLGHASRFFNEHVKRVDALSPHNELVSTNAYCLASPGSEWIIYVRQGDARECKVDLRDAVGKQLRYRFYSPRTGQFEAEAALRGGDWRSIDKPDINDWVVHIVSAPKN
ncbi:MAG: hypothetical protein IT366_07350 [Candidatus Hydrogenedentes bacterium]|nr:hypothetical protein [Candidatus Hydrogenedentota bacterium]